VDEAVAFIAEQVGALRKLAERHKLDVLHYLLGMTKLEAESICGCGASASCRELHRGCHAREGGHPVRRGPSVSHGCL
jgi:hypothetical protein